MSVPGYPSPAAESRRFRLVVIMGPVAGRPAEALVTSRYTSSRWLFQETLGGGWTGGGNPGSGLRLKGG